MQTKPHIFNFRVAYADTDRMGYMYHGTFARYFEMGRVEGLRQRGINYKELEDSGFMMPVLEMQTRFIIPVKYDEACTVETSVTKMEGARVFFVYRMLNEAGSVAATATTVLVVVSAHTKRPCAPPAKLINAFPELHLPQRAS